MNYLEQIANMVWDEIYGTGMDGESSYAWADKKVKPLFRNYALLVLNQGAEVTSEHVHNAWVAWQTGIKPDHRANVPFGDLLPGIQAMDEKFEDAIHAVARKLDLLNG